MTNLKRVIWMSRFVIGATLFGLFVAFAFFESSSKIPIGTLTHAVVGFFIITLILFGEIAWLIVRNRSLDTMGYDNLVLARAAFFLFDAITLMLGTVTAFAAIYLHCPVIDLESVTGKEALYFSMVTFSTLGYGDLTPTDEFQLIASSQALLGLLVFGLLIGYAASLFTDKSNVSAKNT